MVGECKQCELGDCPLHKFPFGQNSSASAPMTSSTTELQDKINRLIYHCAVLGVAIVDDNTYLATESWCALPDDLQKLINAQTERLSKPGCIC